MTHDPTTRVALAGMKTERHGRPYLDLCLVRWNMDGPLRVHHAALTLSHAARSALPGRKRLPDGFDQPGEREEEIAGILAFIGADPIVAHDAAAYKARLPEIADGQWICTLGLVKGIWPEAPGHDLATLEGWLDLERSINAGRDTEPQWSGLVVGTLFERCLSELRLPDTEIRTLVV